jgi:hypothetical protein
LRAGVIIGLAAWVFALFGLVLVLGVGVVSLCADGIGAGGI